jgi:hypothetical protein
MTQIKHAPTIAELYPQLNAEELTEAEAKWTAYLELAVRVFERITSDPTEYTRFTALVATEQLRAGQATHHVADDKKFDSAPDASMNVQGKLF